MPLSLSTAWIWWKAVARRAGAVQARVILALLYFVVLLPFAAILRFTSSPFRTPGWQRHERAPDAESRLARRQF